MYEALASVFKAFSTTFTNSHLDFVMEYNKTWLPNGEVTHLLDPLVLTFLHNTNNLLANGQLTRSRRAVLMNWKVGLCFLLFVCNFIIFYLFLYLMQTFIVSYDILGILSGILLIL